MCHSTRISDEDELRILFILLLDNKDSFVWNLAQAFGALGVAVEVVRSDAAVTEDLGRARAQVGGQVGGPGKALQGNIDPNILFAPPAQIATEVHRVLDSFGRPHTDRTTTGPTHIFNLGHGISQYTPPEHVTALVEAVHSHSRKLRQR